MALARGSDQTLTGGGVVGSGYHDSSNDFRLLMPALHAHLLNLTVTRSPIPAPRKKE